jgi:hypothetical protein
MSGETEEIGGSQHIVQVAVLFSHLQSCEMAIVYKAVQC